MMLESKLLSIPLVMPSKWNLLKRKLPSDAIKLNSCFYSNRWWRALDKVLVGKSESRNNGKD